MNTQTTLKQDWKKLKNKQPHLRIRSAAQQLGVTEVELLATKIGENAIRLRPEFSNILLEVESLGKVMGLTRNDECVHERKGIYANGDFSNPHAGLFVNDDIDQRIFLSAWAKAYAVIEESQQKTLKSLQFFGKDGEAVHKIYLTPASNQEAFDTLVKKYTAEDQTPSESVEKTIQNNDEKPDSEIDLARFHATWEALKDTHAFFGMLREFGVSRVQAMRLAPSEYYAQKISNEAVVNLLEKAASNQVPIMVFVGNKGNIQIHTGEIKKTMWQNQWFNILDPDFNLHLDTSKIAQTFIVRKPAEGDIVTSIEVYNEMGDMIVQFFGKRKFGIPELKEWKELVESLS